jgi:hypothetical protein
MRQGKLFGQTELLRLAPTRTLSMENQPDTMTIRCRALIRNVGGRHFSPEAVAAKTLEFHTECGVSVGGDGGTRTPDPLHAKQVLYQLSYIPT